MINSLFVLVLTSIACSLLGVFLVLRKISMLTDAITHTVLLGIVIAFIFVKDLASPLLTIGATIMGVVTVISIESLGNTKLVKHKDSIGVIYPIFFSIAVIIISKFFRNAHLDIDIVLSGEIIFSSLITTKIFGLEVSKAIIQSGISLTLVIMYILIFYKELKATIFDKEYAILIGINTVFIFYSLMTLTSYVAVSAFNYVGGVLVVSFFIAPSATALLLTKKLKNTLILTIIISGLNASIGFYIAFLLNVSISGFVAFINLFIYILALIYVKYLKVKK